MIETILGALTGGIWMVLGFLFVLTVVVFFHELGHFLVARWCGVTVTTFSVGFGKELFGWTDKYGTHWRFASLPLGGYVKFLDDSNAASAPSEAERARLTPEQLKGAFHNKPVWKRAAVVGAGPLANFLLATVIYAGVNMMYGVRSTPPVIDVVVADLPAARAGIKAGDRVLSISGTSIESFEDIMREVALSSGRTLEFELERDGKPLTILVVPDMFEQKDDLGLSMRLGDIGIARAVPAVVGDVVPDMPAAGAGLAAGDIIKSIDGRDIATFDQIIEAVEGKAGQGVHIVVERAGQRIDVDLKPVLVPPVAVAGGPAPRAKIGISPERPMPRTVSAADSVRLAVRETWSNITQTVSGVVDIVARRQSADQVGGPLLMAEVTAKVVEHGWEPLLRWTALISANIGFLNLLPVPILDGGHLLFYAIEAIRRKPLSQRVQDIGFQIGLALVLMLIVYVNLNDILRIGRRWLFGGS
jgi:regulator of sigma E protease